MGKRETLGMQHSHGDWMSCMADTVVSVFGDAGALELPYAEWRRLLEEKMEKMNHTLLVDGVRQSLSLHITDMMDIDN